MKEEVGGMSETTPTAAKFSRKIQALAAKPVHRGAYFPEDASSRGMALITAKHKDIKLYFMVDPESNAVWDAKFFAYGGALSVAIGETICSLAKEQGVQTLHELSPDRIERELRDTPNSPSAPGQSPEAFEIVNPLVETIMQGYPEAKAVALASGRLNEQKDQLQRQNKESLVETDKQWLKKPKDEQIGVIDELSDDRVLQMVGILEFVDQEGVGIGRQFVTDGRVIS